MHSGSDVMYLLLLSISVTVKKCDCNFSVIIKVLKFRNKIQWAFFLNLLKFFTFYINKFNEIRIVDRGHGGATM